MSSYQQIKETGKRKTSNPKIEGFMEAGLSLGAGSQEDLRLITDEAHSHVSNCIMGYCSQVRPHTFNDGKTPNKAEEIYW